MCCSIVLTNPRETNMPDVMTAPSLNAGPALDEIVENFSLLDEWDDRYRYVIELGNGLSQLPAHERTDANKVQGCVSQVWLATTVHRSSADGPTLTFCGDSDAHIVRGLIAILFALYSGRPARTIVETDAIAVFDQLGLREHLTPEQFRLYDMIWKRALACQMAPAKFDAVSVDLAVGSEANLFRATGQTLVFPGFMAVYMEGVDDTEEEDESKLPALEVGEVLDVLKVWGDQHFTEPPPRYSEASLVKTLEEYGIGRPSTYASIISTLQDREYVILDSKRFKPTDVGRVVNKFLTEHFTKYVDYDFTANLENELDEIADGAREWIPVLDEFWQGFNQQLLDKAGIDRADISHEDIGEPCPKCGKPLISRLGRYGKFISCSAHPECKYARNIDGGSSPAGEPVSVGTDPASGKNIQLLNGPYGPYLQLGEQEEGSKKKPKRVSIPKDIPAADVNLELALKLISLPREIGLHPDTNKKIIAGIGPFGPYLNNDGTFKSIPKSDSIFDIDLPRAVELLAQAKAKAAPLRELGEHPKDGGSVAIYSGRYGPYVQHGKINATLPKDVELDAVTMEQALELLAAKAAKGVPAKKKPAARKAAAGRKK